MKGILLCAISSWYWTLVGLGGADCPPGGCGGWGMGGPSQSVVCSNRLPRGLKPPTRRQSPKSSLLGNKFK